MIVAGGLWLAALAAGAPAARAGEQALADAEVAAPVDAVWALLSDFARWDEVFPAVTSVAVEGVDAERVRLRTRSRVAGRTVRYTLIARVDPAGRRIDCTLEPGEPSDVAALASSWRLAETPEGGTRIELAVRSDSGLGLPQFVERRFTRLSTRQTVDALVAAVSEARRARLAAAR